MDGRQRASTEAPFAAISSAKLGSKLVDIHGQSEHLSLFRPRHHIDLLDRYADLLEVRASLANMVTQLTAGARRRCVRYKMIARRCTRRADLLRHEVEEIGAAVLNPAEEKDLLAERNRLANSEQLATLAAEASLLLNGDERHDRPAAVDSLMAVAAALTKLTRIDPDMADESELAESLAQQSQELALTLSRYVVDAEFDPARLDEVEERLELIKTLKRRFRVDSIAAILAYAERAAASSTPLNTVMNGTAH